MIAHFIARALLIESNKVEYIVPPWSSNITALAKISNEHLKNIHSLFVSYFYQLQL